MTGNSNRATSTSPCSSGVSKPNKKSVRMKRLPRMNILTGLVDTPHRSSQDFYANDADASADPASEPPRPTIKSSSINLLQLATHCVHATLLASRPIQDLRTESRTKSDGTLVTDADGAAQRIIYNEIREFHQDVRIIGEESDLEMQGQGSSSGTNEDDCVTASLVEHDEEDDERDHSLFSQIQKILELDAECHATHLSHKRNKNASIITNNVNTDNSTQLQAHSPSSTTTASTASSILSSLSSLSSSTSTSTTTTNKESTEIDIDTGINTEQTQTHSHANASSSLPSTSMPTSVPVPTTNPCPRPVDVPVPMNIDVKRVSVIVDPLDGTSAYAKGKYEAVTILVAIIVDNTPVFGVIVKPFHCEAVTETGSSTDIGSVLTCFKDTGCSVLYGGMLLGGIFVLGKGELERSRVWRLKEQGSSGNDVDNDKSVNAGAVDSTRKRKKSTTPSLSKLQSSSASLPFKQSERRAIISKSRAGGVVGKCIKSLSSRNLIHPQPLFITGAGYKTLKLLLGEENESLWFFPKAGTSLWDVAAADALLRVMGGRISDRFGRDLDYRKDRSEADNLDGIVACCDLVLHAKCMELYREEKWED